MFDLKEKCLSGFRLKGLSVVVVREGIEPPTQGFSVLCSTN